MIALKKKNVIHKSLTYYFYFVIIYDSLLGKFAVNAKSWAGLLLFIRKINVTMCGQAANSKRSITLCFRGTAIRIRDRQTDQLRFA